MVNRKNTNRQKSIKSEKSECVFSFNNKNIPILKLNVKVWKSSQIVDVGEVLYELSTLLTSNSS